MSVVYCNWYGTFAHSQKKKTLSNKSFCFLCMNIDVRKVLKLKNCRKTQT